MSNTLFKEVRYPLDKIIHDIRMGEIGLPDIQRPFVWKNAKVRDLFDSMLRGFPVGYFLFWASGVGDGYRQVGADDKQQVPRLLIVDGQQRLTSLYAVITGTPVLRENYKHEHIRIAYRPTDRTFAVTDAAIERDPEFIPDISLLWDGDVKHIKFVRQFIAKLKERRDVPEDEEYELEEAIDAVYDLKTYPFTALELSAAVDEEQVAEVFVRINSAGTLLNQADFILTLMSVFWDKGRTQLEEFCRGARTPSATAGPFNQFLLPDPDDMLRVSVGLAFRRGKLQTVYSILRGKDLETGDYSPERRDQQFARLAEAQDYVLDLQHWHDFFKVIMHAGFRRGDHITSKVGLLYTYLLYLIGKRDFGVDENTLRAVIARWFFMSSLTRRYTSSPESVIETDLARLREAKGAKDFVAILDLVVAEGLTRDFWDITLPGELATSSAYSPTMFAYYAALDLLEARVLFSQLRVSQLMDPSAKAKRAALERHHLFPKAYLAGLGINAPGRVNQIANFALVEWPDNANISAKAPSEYWPGMAARYTTDELAPMLYWHALPDGWELLEYDQFLEARRKGMARVIRDGFTRLLGPEAASHDELERTLTKESTLSRSEGTADMIADGEGLFAEFKESARWSYIEGDKERQSEFEILKSVSGFANAKGGTLLVGVHDDGRVIGLVRDFKSAPKQNRDGWENWLIGMLRQRLGAPSLSAVTSRFDKLDDKEIYRIDVEPGREATYVDGRRFLVRIGNTTQELSPAETVDYVRRRWPNSPVMPIHQSVPHAARPAVEEEEDADEGDETRGPWSHERIRERIEDSFLAGQVDSFDEWLAGLGVAGLEVRHDNGTSHTVRVGGIRVMTYYFAMKWMRFRLFDTMQEDIASISAALTAPDSVNIGARGNLAANISTPAEFEALKQRIRAHLLLEEE